MSDHSLGSLRRVCPEIRSPEIRSPRNRAISAFVLPLLAAVLVTPAVPARADLHSPSPSELLPLRDLLGGLWRGGSPPVLEQRAIQDPKKKPAEEADQETKDAAETPAETPAQTPAGTPDEAAPPGETPSAAPPPPLGESILSPRPAAEVELKSPASAFLLSAMLPGLGELYSGSNRGYLFLGVEAVSWITFASYRASSNNKEGELFDFADDHFAIGAFEETCVGQPGQSCQEALDQISNFYANDPDEYYEIISKNPIYRAGWGVVVTPGGWTYENAPPPECGPSDYPCREQYRRWASDQSAAQDRSYVRYNELRDERNSLDRTARGMTMIALVNHVVSAWDALMVARGFNARMPGQVEMDFKIKGSFGNPGARFILRRTF